MITGLRQGFPKIRGTDAHSDATGNVRAGSGYPKQAWLSIWPKTLGAIMQRLLSFVEVANPLESLIKEAMFLVLRKCTQRLAHSFGVSCVRCMSPRVGFPF